MANASSLQIDERDAPIIEGTAKIITLVGSLDARTAASFEECIRRTLGGDSPRIIVDFKGVDYISSAGWGVLIGHVKKFRDRRGDIRLAALNPEAKVSFNLLALNDHFTVFESCEKAVAKSW